MNAGRNFFLFICICVVIPLTPLSAGAAASTSLRELEARLATEERRQKELEKKIADYRKSIKQMDAKAGSLLDRIDRSRQDVKRTEQEITVLELQNARLQKSMELLNKEMEQAKTQIGSLSILLKRRLVEMYKYGSVEGLQAILSAESTQEALDSAYLLNRLAKHDRFLMEQLQSKTREIALSQKTIEDHKSRLKQQTQALSQERRKYDTTIKQSNDFLNDIRREKAMVEKMAREMEEAQKAVGETIMTLIRQKKEREEAARRAGTGGVGINHLEGRGTMFEWPLRGSLSSPFGSRVHPVFKTKSFHSGLDIAAPRGTPIRAAAPGEVLFVGWLRGYGQVVIVGHGKYKGNEYSTVYAHMSATSAREGALVGVGSVLGSVGNTGTATGYHLHFEVRVGSTAKNPLDYLKK